MGIEHGNDAAGARWVRPKRAVRGLLRSAGRAESGQLEGDPGTAEGRLRGTDRTAVRLDHRPRDRQPEAAASGRPRPPRVGAGEAIEDPLALGERDARPVVVDLDQQPPAAGDGRGYGDG